MKLYYAPGTCALAPHIVIREAGLSAELVRVDLATKKTEHAEDYLSVNSCGYVPALQLDDGTVLTEVAVILQYLGDLKPELGLLPANGTLPRYQLQGLLNFISSEVHKAFSPLFDPRLPAEQKSYSKQRATGRFGFLDETLSAHPYLTGEHLTVADPYLFTVLSWTRYVDIDLSAWPALQAYQERMAQRPAVLQAMKEQGLIK